MTDIVKRLRTAMSHMDAYDRYSRQRLDNEAADKIERLTAALQEIADAEVICGPQGCLADICTGMAWDALQGEPDGSPDDPWPGRIKREQTL